MGEARYLTDDRDERHRNELVITPGGNGDWYVAVVPEGQGAIGRAVRISTSGGAQFAAPGLGVAVAQAYHAIRGTSPERSPIAALPCADCNLPPVWADSSWTLKCPVAIRDGGFRAFGSDREDAIQAWNRLVYSRLREMCDYANRLVDDYQRRVPAPERDEPVILDASGAAHLAAVASGTVMARSTHAYADHDGTSDCANGCGCWVGPYRSGGPEGVDPFGPCPKAPAPERDEPGAGQG